MGWGPLLRGGLGNPRLVVRSGFSLASLVCHGVYLSLFIFLFITFAFPLPAGGKSERVAV